MNYKKRIQHFIEENNLFALNDNVLVALSGGADSVALLRVLIDLGYTCECAHCNFHLRGEESDRDEQFVRSLCQEHQIPLHVKHFETESYAKEKQISIEMAARELRYTWFEELRKETKANVIAPPKIITKYIICQIENNVISGPPSNLNKFNKNSLIFVYLLF